MIRRSVFGLGVFAISSLSVLGVAVISAPVVSATTPPLVPLAPTCLGPVTLTVCLSTQGSSDVLDVTGNTFGLGVGVGVPGPSSGGIAIEFLHNYSEHGENLYGAGIVCRPTSGMLYLETLGPSGLALTPLIPDPTCES